MVLRGFLVSALAVIISGCASKQLNYNTVDIATAVQAVYTGQVLGNLSKFIDEPNAIPSQVDLSAGTIQTSNSVTPTITFPLSSSFATAVGATSTTRTSTIAGAGLSIGASDNWQQNYTVAPVNDSNALRNLRALYRHAVWNNDLAHEFMAPLGYTPTGKLVHDLYYLRRPHCVLCATPKGSNQDETDPENGDEAFKTAVVSEKLPGGWLFWEANRPKDEADLIPLGHYGNHELFMRKADYASGVLADFTLFVLPNAEPPKGTSAQPPRRAPAANLFVPQSILPPQ